MRYICGTKCGTFAVREIMLIKTSFRLEESTVKQIKQLAKHYDTSQGGAVCIAVQNCIDAVHSEVQENQDESASEVKWKELYFTEKKRNDELSDRLLSLSEKVTDTFRAEKVTNAFDAGVKILESTEQKEERKTRWQRLKEAWRGE